MCTPWSHLPNFSDLHYLKSSKIKAVLKIILPIDRTFSKWIKWNENKSPMLNNIYGYKMKNYWCAPHSKPRQKQQQKTIPKNDYNL